MKFSTQTEIKQSVEAKLLTLGHNIEKKIIKIEDVGDYIPGSVMVQDLSIMTNTYMNEFGCDFLMKSKEELKAMGEEYFSRFFPLEEIKILKAELQQFVLLGDRNKITSFFQRVKPEGVKDYSWYFTTSRLYPIQEPGFSMKVVHVAIPANMLSYAGRKLNALVDEDIFVRKNYHRFNLLSNREKEVIRLVVEGKSSIEIASSLFLSIHTVNNHRKNIIHKLEVTSLSQLVKFAVSFGII
jgi:LuxR family transcriptional regulator